MMRPRVVLLRWLLSGLWLVTVPAVLIAAGFVLCRRDVLDRRSLWAASLFVVVHSLAVAVCLGRSRSAAFGYLYTRGFSRNALWSHAMLASAVSVLIVWLPCTLAVWTGARSWLQDVWLNNALFPLMRPREQSTPWIWLAMYAFILPLLHYAWIRQAQPTRGPNSGFILLAAVLIAGLTLADAVRYEPSLPAWLAWGTIACGVVAAVGAWRLHRTMEVRA